VIRWSSIARRARFRRTGDDAGFVLPYVMLVTFLVMVGTAAMLGAVANNSVPARRSQDSEAALAAAQAGVQAYVAALNANCSSYYTVTSSYSIEECSWPASAAATPLTSGSSGAPALTTGSYAVQASNTSGFLNANQDDIRIVSAGTSNGATVKLVADVSGTPNALRFSYFTDHESTDPDFLASYFPARSVSVPGSSLLSLLGLSIGGSAATVTWGGLTAGSAVNCGAVWYNDPGNPTVGGIGRSGAGDDVVETGTLSPAAAGVTPSIDHVCSVDFTAGMNFDGPVYSHDALYLSNGVPGNSTGPNFSVPTACGGSTLTDCEPLPPASSAWSSSDTPVAPASPYRSVASPLGGTPTSNNANVQTVQTSKFDVTLPSSVSDAAAVATCSYTSGVTITISGGTATVSGAGAAGQSSACLSVPVSKTTLYVVGDATISSGGNLSSGRLSIVSTGDIVLKGSLTTSAAAPSSLPTNANGEPSASGSTPAIDLVALDDVRVTHTVTCADGSNPSAATGYCPNDISGLYTTDQAGEVVNSDGTLKTTHPARQYCNSTGARYPCSGSKTDCESVTGGLTVTAAIFALTGSLQTDNYSRGCGLGTLTVNGGVYTNFRGPLGQEWEVPSSGATTRSYSGYKLKLNYVNLESAGLQYVPALEGGSVNHPWGVISVSGAS
jgi:hypothetical protein